MTDMLSVLIVFLIFVLLFLLSQMGRIGHKGLDGLRGWNYAHRGLHSNGVPENSMAAFQKALEHGYGIELDLHLMKDGTLAVIHDASLKRTAGVDIQIESLTREDLKKYTLEGTDEWIPVFDQVLELYAGKAPLIIELKPVNGNHAALCHAACEAMKGYSGAFCMESFDPRCVHWLRRNRPQIIRGQLAENFLVGNSSMPFLLKAVMSWNLMNFLTRPDFVAYKFHDRKNLSIAVCRKLWRLQGVTWTLRAPADHAAALKEGWIPIFENYIP